MKSQFATGCGVSFLILLCLVVFSIGMGPRFAAAEAKNRMAEYTPAAPTAEQQAAAVTPVAGAVSEQALVEMLRDLQGHDERMVDKVVQVAESGDAAQTVTAVSGDMAGAAVPCLIGIVILAGFGWMFTRRSDSSE